MLWRPAPAPGVDACLEGQEVGLAELLQGRWSTAMPVWVSTLLP